MHSKEKKNIFFEISVKPSKYAIKWLDHRSILATFFLWLIWLCRVFSLLQWLKFLYRKLFQWAKDKSIKDNLTYGLIKKIADNYSKDKIATRPDVPAWFPEVYFCIWFIVLFIAYLFKSYSCTLKIFAYYYLFETFVWIIYYTIFRRFFEENYTIYHALEYLLPLLVIFPTQALCVSIIYRLSLGTSILTILGQGNENVPAYINIMGILYGAIVIGLLVDKFPEEKVKERSIKVHIIGFGDVVNNRLLPSLLNNHYSNNDIVIYDIKNSPYKRNNLNINNLCSFYNNSNEIINRISRTSGPETLICISSPSSTHVDYLYNLLEKTDGLIACEKPICINEVDLDKVKEINNDINKRKRVFYFSYYLLEKALPLYYFFNRNFRYLSYLNIDGNINEIQGNLGNLKRIEVVIKEGNDFRMLNNDGGQYFETFLHNVLIASLPFENFDNFIIENLHHSISKNEIVMNARNKKIKINLKQTKNSSMTKRFAKFEYKNGTVMMDIDNGILSISKNKKILCDISIKEEFKSVKYSIQEDLLNSVHNGIYYSKDVDGLYHQVETIDFLIKHKNEMEELD